MDIANVFLSLRFTISKKENKLHENRTLKRSQTDKKNIEIKSTFQMKRIYFDLIITRLIVQK